MPKVLIIARNFPPLGSAGGSIRLVKLLKYANREGWIFTVLTQDLKRPVITEKVNCDFLLVDVPKSAKIIRVPNPVFNWQKTFLRVITGDSSIPWGINVIVRVLKNLRKDRPDLVFVNSPPFTNVGVGLVFASLYRIPLVVDLKDDWIGSVAYQRKSRIRRWLERLFESTVFKRAAAIITVSQSSFDFCNERYTDKRIQKNIHLIPNGEDLEEFQYSQINEQQKKVDKFRFTSGAAGYRPDYRDLSPFIESLEDCLAQNPSFKLKVEIAFLGEDPDEEYKARLSRILPDRQIHFLGSLNRPELVTELRRSDCFFLVQPRGNNTAISGTLYEYRAINKAPVLLFSETGASSDFVLLNRIGIHFQFDKKKEASMWIQKAIRLWMDGKPILIESKNREIFDRAKIADAMTKIWAQAISTERITDWKRP